MIVLDTHAFIWAMEDQPRLGPEARNLVNRYSEDNSFGVSAITPWEIALLVEKGRLGLNRDAGGWIEEALSHPRIRLLPIEPKIAIESVRLPGKFHLDPADRFIIATARHWDAPLLTADSAMVSYGKRGHFRVVDAQL